MSFGERLRHWLAARGHNLAWVRKIALWQARMLPAPYALRFRFARWANLLALESGAPSEVAVARDGFRFVLDLQDRLQWETYYFGGHEPHLMRVFLKLLQPNTSVIDLGAHIGVYTLWAGRFCQGRSAHPCVLAVEPNPVIFARLQRHLALNDLTEVVHAAHVAIGDCEAEATLYLSTYPNSANSALRDLRGNHPHTQDGTTIQVRLAQLDTLVHEVGLTRPVGLIKADIEGAELEAFHGAATVLTSDRPFVLFEAHPIWMQRFGYALVDMLSFWRAQHYYCYRVDHRGVIHTLDTTTPHRTTMDCLAVPEEHVQLLSRLELKVASAR